MVERGRVSCTMLSMIPKQMCRGSRTTLRRWIPTSNVVHDEALWRVARLARRKDAVRFPEIGPNLVRVLVADVERATKAPPRAVVISGFETKLQEMIDQAKASFSLTWSWGLNKIEVEWVGAWLGYEELLRVWGPDDRFHNNRIATTLPISRKSQSTKQRRVNQIAGTDSSRTTSRSSQPTCSPISGEGGRGDGRERGRRKGGHRRGRNRGGGGQRGGGNLSRILS